jgi:hypothetical protein
MGKILHIIIPVILILMVAILQAQVDPGTANLTNSWTFNDGTPNDYVGSANGTLMGAAFIDGGSLSTVETDSWMEIPAEQVAINTFQEITLEAWFIPLQGSNTGYHMLAYFGNSVNSLGSDGYFISPARGDNKSRTAISCGNESAPWSAESGADGPELDDGELHHVVSTLSAADITLYIDGELKMTTPLSASNSIALLSTNYAYLAKGGYTGDAAWKGEILEFNIYNKALSAEEVLFLFNKGASPTGVNENNSNTPDKFALYQNYPNPFNPTTTINFSLPKAGFTNIEVFDMVGRSVAILVNEELEAGYHTVNFNAANLTSGIYFYSLKVGDFSSVKKLILLK